MLFFLSFVFPKAEATVEDWYRRFTSGLGRIKHAFESGIASNSTHPNHEEKPDWTSTYSFAIPEVKFEKFCTLMPSFLPHPHNKGNADYTWESGKRYSDAHLTNLAFRTGFGWYTHAFTPEDQLEILKHHGRADDTTYAPGEMFHDKYGCMPTDIQKAEKSWYPPDAKFVSDVTWLSRPDFEVRPKVERYGSLVYFDASLKPIGIWFCPRLELMMNPNDGKGNLIGDLYGKQKRFEEATQQKIKKWFGYVRHWLATCFCPPHLPPTHCIQPSTYASPHIHPHDHMVTPHTVTDAYPALCSNDRPENRVRV